MEREVLRVRDLWVYHRSDDGKTATLKGVDFSLAAGECLSVLGESGAGKSTLARVMTGLLPPSARVLGRMRLDGTEIDLSSGGTDWPGIRGSRIGLVLQDAQQALNPMRKVGAQFRETLLFHQAVPRDEVLPTARSILEFLNFGDADAVLDSYPFQLSGGMCQRVCLALALCLRPRVLIADEATSALDGVSRAEVIGLLGKTRERLGLSIVFITHDIAVACAAAEKLLVLEDGTVRDYGPVRSVLGSPRSAFTSGLVGAARRIPVLSTEAGGRLGARPAVLEVENLSKSFGAGGGAVLCGLSLSVARGEIVGVLGGSGCGKSTLARCLVGLEEPDSGRILFEGESLSAWRERDRKGLNRGVQLIFQDGRACLNPGRRVLALAGEPLRYMKLCGKRERDAAAARSLTEAGIGEELFMRRPPELSTGQCQRVAIARALSAGPRLLICDEATSALDAATRNQVLEFLMEINGRDGISILLISHDVGILKRCCHRVVVMDGGRFVEDLLPSRLDEARHPSTRKLLRSERTVASAFSRIISSLPE